MTIVAVVISFIVGFGAAWLVHTILASKEFDQLLWQSESEKQELINQFNDKIEEIEEKYHK